MILKLRVLWEKNVCKSYIDRDLVSKIYSYNSIIKETNNNGQRNWTDISSRKIHKWSTSTRKDAWTQWSLRKCKSKPHEILLHTYSPGWLQSKKTDNNKCRQGCGDTEILIQRWWEYKILQLLLENSLAIPQKVKLLYDPVISFLSIPPPKKGENKRPHK